MMTMNKAAIAAAIVGAIYFFSDAPSTTATATTKPATQTIQSEGCGNLNLHRVDLHTSYRRAIQNQLKSPSSAKFSSIGNSRETRAIWVVNNPSEKQCEILLTGWVDAQNGFGATIRSNYRVVTKLNFENNRWETVAFEM